MGEQKNQVDAPLGDAERPRWSRAAALGHGGRMSRQRNSATVLRVVRGSGNGIARPGCRSDSQTASHALSGWKGSSRPNYYWGGSACLELDQRSRNREDRGQTGCLTADVNTAEFGGGPCVRRAVMPGRVRDRDAWYSRGGTARCPGTARPPTPPRRRSAPPRQAPFLAWKAFDHLSGGAAGPQHMYRARH